MATQPHQGVRLSGPVKADSPTVHLSHSPSRTSPTQTTPPSLSVIKHQTSISSSISLTSSTTLKIGHRQYSSPKLQRYSNPLCPSPILLTRSSLFLNTSSNTTPQRQGNIAKVTPSKRHTSLRHAPSPSAGPCSSASSSPSFIQRLQKSGLLLSASLSPNSSHTSRGLVKGSFLSSSLHVNLTDSISKNGPLATSASTNVAESSSSTSTTPRRVRSRAKTYDRFIPNRQIMDMAASQFNLRDPIPSPKRLDQESLSYQEQIAKACGVALDRRILTFHADPPPSSSACNSANVEFRTNWNRPLRKPNAALTKRRIPTLPHKILDAPGLVDDYYLNLLDWSSRNILAVGLESTVYLWNAETGDVQEFCSTKDADSICSLQWSNDGGYLGIGTNLGDVQIWDMESGSKLRTMRGHASRVGVLAWDKHILSSGTRDGSIWHHDVRVPQHKVAELLGHSAEVCGLKWRADGQQLASGGNDNSVIIWDAQSSQPKHVKTEHQAAVKAIAWCPWQLTTLATGGGAGDKNIHFWNTVSGEKLSTISAGSQVTSLVWSKEYKELLSSHGFPNNELSLWSYPSGQKITDFPGHDCRVLHTSLSPDGQTVVSGAADENLKFWNVFESKKQAGKKSGPTGSGDGQSEKGLMSSFKKMSIR